METIFTPENLYSILSGRTHSVFNRALVNNFRKNNIALTKEQWTILGVLWQDDGCSQQTLADRTHKDKPGITRLIDNLEKEVIEIVNQTLEDAIKGIDPKNLEIVRDTFQQIYDNLEPKTK